MYLGDNCHYLTFIYLHHFQWNGNFIITLTFMDNTKFKANEYPGTQSKTYLNTAACGLISKGTAQKISAFNQRFLEEGSHAAENWMAQHWDDTRAAVGEFVGASLEDVALVPNFSYAYNALLETMGKQRVLVYENDYPSLLLPLQLKSFDIHTFGAINHFAFDYSEIEEELIKNEIQLLAISHIQYRTGYKADLNKLGQLCKRLNVRLIVDATQSAGAVELNFSESNIDALIWSNYKWMNAGLGTGIICIKSGLLEQFQPKIGGYGSYEYKGEALVYQAGIKSFQPSHPNVLGYEGIASAIEEKQQIGISNIEKHNAELLQYLLVGLKARNKSIIGDYSAASRGGYLCMPYTEEQFDKLKQHRVIVTYREKTIRVAVHFYNTKADVDRFLNLV